MCPFGSPLDIRQRSVGQAIPGTQIKAVEQETGKEVGTNEVGEMMVLGYQLSANL